MGEAMRRALADGGRSAGDVDYVNAHGTSTKLNDAAETRAIKQVFGAAASSTPVSSSKSMLGHLVAACGAVEAIACIQSLQTGRIHGTANLEHPDPECDLNYLAAGSELVPGGVGVAVSNSFGFGGCNASLVLGAP